ncbi:hypothetical protein BC936DRAFT_141057 [Jimgerdemannia flammicorona]|uniref:Uncharacterized protein n=1 Tax=Jimgerdemannia flammicorona TaxID=994334 RepID=A0A433DGE2_9FUNG|nr:hypothetical protein BC936DRAFT_141057 [Jimgerdemannia flammicorona]
MQPSTDQRSYSQVGESQKPVSEQVQDDAITAASISGERDGFVNHLIDIFNRYGVETERRQLLEHQYSEAQEEIEDLKRKNALLKEEMDKLRATVIGSDYEAWSIGAVLKIFESLRQQWLSLYLFGDSAKNGSLLTASMESVFRETQKLLKDQIKEVCEHMFDYEESPTNIQFITGVLQSNYKTVESDLRLRIRKRARKEKAHDDLKISFLEISNQDQFDALFDTMIKISGMLFLCDQKLTISHDFDRHDTTAYTIVITSADKQVICFPGIRSIDVNGRADWKSKVWVATRPRLAK